LRRDAVTNTWINLGIPVAHTYNMTTLASSPSGDLMLASIGATTINVYTYDNSSGRWSGPFSITNATRWVQVTYGAGSFYISYTNAVHVAFVMKFTMAGWQWTAVGPATGVGSTGGSGYPAMIKVNTEGDVFMLWNTYLYICRAATNTWTTSSAFGAGGTSYEFDVSPSGVAYVAYRSTTRLTVKSYDSATNTWILVGLANFTESALNTRPIQHSIVCGPGDRVAVAYCDATAAEALADTYFVTCRIYNTVTNLWDIVKSKISASAYFVRMLAGSNGKLFALVRDRTVNKLTLHAIL
jgi:hypothetical protein